MLRVSSGSSSQEGSLEMPARSTSASIAFECTRVDPPHVGANQAQRAPGEHASAPRGAPRRNRVGR